jgi:hypothetical protein
LANGRDTQWGRGDVAIALPVVFKKGIYPYNFSKKLSFTNQIKPINP